MKKIILGSLAAAVATATVLAFASHPAQAATTPNLGAAASYGVLAGTYTNTSAGTTVTGDIGFTTPPAVAPLGAHTNYGSGAPTPTARIDAGNALSTGLAPQSCTFNFAGGAVDISTAGPNGATGVYPPGVYCATGDMTIGTGGITLNGTGTYIFRTVGSLLSVDNSHVTLNGASACDVFWTPTAATTLGANTTFAGTIIDNANAISIGANTVYTGRALSLGAGTVTTGNTSTVTAPTCAVQALPGGTSVANRLGTVNVVKLVINDNGGTQTVSDFHFFVNGVPVQSGITNVFPALAVPYTVTETPDPNYTRTFSGDCDVNGQFNLITGDNKFCIITNNDIAQPAAVVTPPVVPPVPPLIDVLKVPSPLALPGGPGMVQYSYILRNIGTVPVTNISMVGDTCSPIVLANGDNNGDNILQTNEVWTYHCNYFLPATHTNTVVATGWANGISATDIASATVIVGQPIVPPLIHITKTPSPLALKAGGGWVTYTKKVSNPGTVALSNVRVNDNKCGPVTYISGDTNRNSKLDTNETWTYTCKSRLAQTTTNTAVARGDANGLTARDFAIATVVVALPAPVVPKLPNTGLAPFRAR